MPSTYTALQSDRAPRFRHMFFTIFHRLVGRYYSYLLPKQVLETHEKNITHPSARSDAQRCSSSSLSKSGSENPPLPIIFETELIILFSLRMIVAYCGWHWHIGVWFSSNFTVREWYTSESQLAPCSAYAPIRGWSQIQRYNWNFCLPKTKVFLATSSQADESDQSDRLFWSPYEEVARNVPLIFLFWMAPAWLLYKL